jgi:kumamolisin
MSTRTVSLAGSTRAATIAATPVGPADQEHEITVTVYVRRDPRVAPLRSPLEQAPIGHQSRRYLSAEQAQLFHGADPSDIDAVVRFARRRRLTVVEQSENKRLVRLRGTVAAMGRIFGVKLVHYQHPSGAPYRSHAEEVQIPAPLAGIVEGVLGLDNRKMARSYLRPSKIRVPTSRQATGSLPPNVYLPPTVAQLFELPPADGSGECVAVLAFNGSVMSTGESVPGGYDPTALTNYFEKVVGQSAPSLVDVVVQGPGNKPGDGSGGDSTGEVLLDLCVVGSVSPAAKIAVYFTEFTEEGWVNAIKAAVADTTNRPSVISISYGNPEDDQQQGLWMEQTIRLVNEAFKEAANQGMTICCASGDDGAPDEPSAAVDHVDFPASSPWVLGVGGTRLEADSSTMTISSEVVWNDVADKAGATGGGVSRLFALPSWQQHAGVPTNADGSGKTGRGVPDVASLADPETPFAVMGPDGHLHGVGGTSAAAPLWSALIARLNQATGARLGYLNAELYARLGGALVDITSGNNSADQITGYSAAVGWDACTGWGRPDGARLLAALTTPAAPSAPGVGVPSTPVVSITPVVPAAPVLPGTPGVSGPGSTATPAPAGTIGQRLFSETQPGADETSFEVDNTSSKYYSSPYYLAHKNMIQPIPTPATSPPRIDLAQVVDTSVVTPILAAQRIAFHSVGDTGAAKVNSFQTAAHAIANEASVANAMAADLQGADAPAFLFHLGDVVYNFGEGQYYYDQFYEPFRAYDRPIFAIPGNHDGMVFGTSPDLPQVPTLTAFLRNFCAPAPATSPDAGGLVRSTMTQPSVYFTLDAPFVSIIGLYTNVLEGPGVVSSQGGTYPINDDQLQFLIGELTRLKSARAANQRAVIIACHHPPASTDSKHGGTTGLAKDIDAAAQAAGLWPDAVLSGHAHLYQRFTRSVDGRQIPYIVAGSGGFSATAPQAGLPPAPVTVGEYTLEIDPIVAFGYLTVTVDMSGSEPTLGVAFKSTDGATEHDSVTVALSTGTIASP